MRKLSRRGFLATGGAALSLGLTGRSIAQDAGQTAVRIGTVFPSRTGQSFIKASVNDYIGESARMGAILADSELGTTAAADGLKPQILLANSPTVDAAVRAGERLVETGNICALVGGVGEGQAEALARIADQAKIPFFNVGATSGALRGAGCSRYVFHVEASDAMYLDALADLAKSLGHGRLYVVSDDTERGKALLARAGTAAEKVGIAVAGSAEVRSAQPVYYNEAEELKAADADVILVLLHEADQLTFVLQMEEVGVELPVLTFPHTITQTRDFIAAARHRLPKLNPLYRVALWETTIPEPSGNAFNEMVRARWGESADPTSWATYHAIKIIIDTVAKTGSTDADAMIEYLESPEASFDLRKGPGLSFRPWDHQLRQPLYVVKVDQQAEWHMMDLDSRIGIASYERALPAELPGGEDPQAWLDQIGDGASLAACKL